MPSRSSRKRLPPAWISILARNVTGGGKAEEGDADVVRRAIVEVLMELWGVNDVVATDNRLVAEANTNLAGGITEEEFSRELAHRVWEANQDFCDVSVRMIYLEELPYEDYVFASPDEYEEWLQTSSKT